MFKNKNQSKCIVLLGNLPLHFVTISLLLACPLGTYQGNVEMMKSHGDCCLALILLSQMTWKHVPAWLESMRLSTDDQDIR